jgi:hypothetical protein
MSSFSHLKKFLIEVSEHATTHNVDMEEAFHTLLKSKHYWPALQWKKFNDNSGLILLHNTYKRTDVEEFKDLYDECRSVVLDLSAPLGDNIVITLSNSIPERLTDQQYKTKMSEDDLVTMSYEGTVISVYEHKGKWYFGTSSCPSVDSSRYFHPTKRHGTMMDEVLDSILPGVSKYAMDGINESDDKVKVISMALRNAFTNILDPSEAYFFVLVHHENQHLVDYTSEFGPDYKKLVHIMTKCKETKTEIHIPDPFLAWDHFTNSGLIYAKKFDTPTQGVEWIEANPESFGVIVKQNSGKLFKVSHSNLILKEEEDLGNPNVWMNMLWVYMQNKPHYHVNDYIKKFCPDLENPTDQYGRSLAPVYIIHTVICTMRDYLYQCYRYTTRYYPQYKRWKMNKQLDQELPRIVRFHLSQLRNIQVTTHADEFLTPHTVYHYLCHHQTMGNIRQLIAFFADPSDNTFNVSAKTAECFKLLHKLLQTR